MAAVKIRKAAEELAALEASRDELDARIKELRGNLIAWMAVDDTVTVDHRVLAKRERVNWEVSPAEVYAEVGPRKFVSYVKSVNIPKVREDLGKDWLKEHGDMRVTEYVTWTI